MAERPIFQQHQYAFAAHIRNPDSVKGPDGIEDRRMAVYRELFYNNVEGFLSRSFPVIRRLYSDERWHAMARDYFANHLSETPYFLEIPKEFLRYLTDERDNESDPAFLQELAHYEWAELALSILDVDLEQIPVGDDDLLDGVPVLSPAAWSLAYQYPVHQIKPDFQPESPGEIPSFIVVYRALDDKVGFIEINPVTARLLELMNQNDTKTSRELLATLAHEINHPNPDVVINGGRDILNNLRAHDIVLGTLPQKTRS